MKSFYEKSRDDDRALVVHSASKGFPAHYHRNLEIAIVLSGEQKILINDKWVTLTNGCLTLIDSYDIHTYEKFLGSDDGELVVIIPYEYMGEFNERRKHLQPISAVIIDKKLCESLAQIVREFMIDNQPEYIRKSGTALFLSVLYEGTEWTVSKTRDEASLARKILSYIYENYRKEISRTSIARALGYTEAHISRVFSKYLKTGISAYVNGLRLNYIEEQLRAGDERKIVELIYDAGFKSQQTYYRVKNKN